MKKVIITEGVAVKGKHYPVSKEAVSLEDRDAIYLLNRGIAVDPEAVKKAAKDEKSDK